MITYGLFLYIALTLLVTVIAHGTDQAGVVPLRRFSPYLSRKEARNILCSAEIFILLAGVSLCRIAVGNDYWVYRDNFKLIAQDRYVSYEPGFTYVVKFLQWFLSYDNYLPIFAFFSIVTTFFMVKALHEQGEWFVFSVYIFMTAGYYFGSLNNVRYYFALSIAMYSIKYIHEKDYVKFTSLIILASLFHKSVLIVIPLYILAAVKWNVFGHMAMALACGSFIAVPGLYRKVIFLFYPFYEGSMFDKGLTSITSIGRALAIFLFSLIYIKKVRDDAKLRFGFYCNLFALLLYTFCSFMPEISRIGFYLSITNVFYIPSLLLRIENKKAKAIWSILIALAFAAFFALFLKSAYQTDIRILPYYNWIFQ